MEHRLSRGYGDGQAPAYANRRVYLRNDEELIVVSLAQDDYR